MRISKVVSAKLGKAAAKGRWVMGIALLAWTISIFPSGAASVQLLSTRDSSFALPAGGNGPSVEPVVTPDGRFVLFASSANDLVTNANSQYGLNLYLRDRRSNSTTLVSANYRGTGGGNDSSMCGSVSTNGRYVVFQSVATDLLTGDTNAVGNDIFVRDMWTGTTRLVSAATNGSWPTGASREPAMTPDGHYVAFVSGAASLTAGDNNNISDVFVRDMVSGTTTLVSVGATNYSIDNANLMRTPVMTPDGHYVAYYSTVSNLVAGVTNTYGDIYVRDLVGGTTTWASSNAAPLALAALGVTNAPSTHPVLSDSGQFLAFKCGPTMSGSAALILLYDATSGLTTVASTNGAPAWGGNEEVYGPEITADGHFIAYAALDNYSSALVYSSLHLWDSWTDTDTLVSVGLDGSFPTNTISKAPVFSADGLQVAFLSNATNLVTNAVSGGFHVYVRDLVAQTTALVDADPTGAASGDADGTVPSLSDDGRFVAFSSADGTLVSGDTNGFLDVFLRDTTGTTTELVSQREPAVPSLAATGISSASQNSVTPDGRWVAFASRAPDLVTNDFNGYQDVFVRDLVMGQNLLVSVGADGNAALGGDSSSPVQSADGRYVVFLSRATNLTANPANIYANVYRRDLLLGTTVLVSVGTDGRNPGNGDSTAPLTSQDGRYVVFASAAKNLVTNGPALNQNVFWRDMDAGQTVPLIQGSYSPQTLYAPTLSADGRYVAYTVNIYFNGFTTWQLNVWDAQRNAMIYTNTLDFLTSSSVALGPAAISPTGKWVLYTSNRFVLPSAYYICVADPLNNSNVFSYQCSGTIRVSSQGAGTWSYNDRFFTFATNATPSVSFSPVPTNIFLGDVQKRTVKLISTNKTGTAVANGRSDLPVISGDGHYVAFRSFATDIAPGITNTPNLIVYDRLSNTLATVEGPGWDWSSWIFNPAISGTGNTIAFQSWQSVLVPGDENRLPDVFTANQQQGVAVDSDGDGIPDWWTMEYFGHPMGWFMDQSRATDDPDADGVTNLQEYLAGTDPANRKSVLRIQITTTLVADSVAVTWVAAPGRAYRVQFKAGLDDPSWHEALYQPTVVGSQASFVVPPALPGAYYRVVAGVQ